MTILRKAILIDKSETLISALSLILTYFIIDLTYLYYINKVLFNYWYRSFSLVLILNMCISKKY